MLVEMQNTHLTTQRQCALIGLARSSFYYEPQPETAQNLELMRLLDEQYTRTPFYGSPRLTQHLRALGHPVGHKRVERLMVQMGLAALQPRKNLSKPGEKARKYPYLLRDFKIVRPGQVWSSDITYIGLKGGFLYLVAVLDWYSRYVLAWELSNSLDSSFCLDTLARALEFGKPEIFNTDQGSQFTSAAWTGLLEQAGIAISMDGRGRCFDNIFTERLWRSVKYEEVYLKDYADGQEVWHGLDRYFTFYNEARFHQALDWRTPAQVHFEERKQAAA